MMTELQQIEFNIFKTFIDICERLQLEYFLVCGSALGAVKYQGFIPWDDDMDVALPRDDYERFLDEAPAMLPKHLFLQNYKSEPRCPYCYSKLRNSETTFIEKSVVNIPMNHGVCIDVFPLDGYPAGRTAALLLELRKNRFLLMMSANYVLKRSWRGKIGLVGKLFGYCKKPGVKLARYTRMISGYPVRDSEIWCNHGNWQGKLEYSPRRHYGNGILANFEGLKVRIPENYDEYLTQKYGDWKAELPDSKKTSHHCYEVCDLTRSYKDYIEYLPNGRIHIKKKNELSSED